MPTINKNKIGEFKLYEPKEKIVKGKKKYYVRFVYYDADGVRRDSNGKLGLTKSQAKNYAQDALEKKLALIDEKTSKRTSVTLGQVAQEFYDFIANLPLDVKSASGKASKTSDLRPLFINPNCYTPKYLLDKPINKFDKDDISRYLNYLRTLKLHKTGKIISPTYYGKFRTAIKDVFEYALSQNYLLDYEHYESLTVTIKSDNFKVKVKKKKNNELRFITEEQYIKFQSFGKFPHGVFEGLDNIDCIKFDRDYMLFMLFGMFYFAGLRTSELRCLRWKHINFINIDPLNVEESTVSVSIEEGWANRVLPQDRDKYESVRGKGYLKNENARRIIPIKGYYALDLDEYNTYFKNLYKTEDIDEYLLFPAKRNKNKLIGETTIDDNLKLRHKNIIDEVEEFSKKDFRASCADRMRVQGYTYEQLLDFFGHEDSDMLKKVYKRGDAQHNYEILDKTLKPDAFGVQSQNEHIEKVFGKKENEE